MLGYNTTDTVSIYQFKRTGNTEAYNSTPAYTNINAGITPAGTDIQLTYGGMEGYQIYEIFIWDSTLLLKNGDKIVTEAGVAYIVAGVPQLVNNRYLQYIKVVGRLVV